MSYFSRFEAEAKFSHAPFNAAQETQDKFNALASEAHFDTNVVLYPQHGLASRLSFLVQGSAEFRKHHASESTQLGVVSHSFAPMGISGLSSPGRYMSEISVSAGSQVITLDLKKLRDLFLTDPAFGARFLSFVLGKASILLWATRGLNDAPDMSTGSVSAGTSHATDRDIVQRVSETAFFAPFARQSLIELLKYSELKLYSKGEMIELEGGPSNSLNILFSGRVTASYTDARSGKAKLMSRTVARPGVSLSWCNGYTSVAAPYTIEASRDTTMISFTNEQIRSLISDDPLLACTLLQQQLWQIGRYQQTATGLANLEVSDVIAHIKALLQDNSARIPVTSGLYSVPHALESRFTIAHALDCVYSAIVSGNDAERSLGGLMIDILQGVERQHRFFKSLNAVYHRVAGASIEFDSKTLRELSNADFSRAFDQVAYVIKGMENLPDNPAQIFFYNHLAGISENELANGHAFSIDSHFISSKIFLPRYGDSGQRIVRSSRNTEFWRNGYYVRLDNIFVDNPESDWKDETPEQKQERKAALFTAAQKTLQQGRPLAIAPEGTSETPDNLTPTSPGPMKVGAFLMAGKFEPKPMLIPIALANFDYSVSSAIYSAVIKEPFYINDYVKDVDNRDEMSAFLKQYRETFRTYVAEARELADQAQNDPESLTSDIVTNIGFVSPVEEEFESDVRELEKRVSDGQARGQILLYGSSTFRLWTDAERDLGTRNLVNLGFGGSTLQACRTYFTRLVPPHHPGYLIIYAGDNDIGGGASGLQVAQDFSLFMSEVNEHLPDVRCIFIAIKPSPFRQHLLEEIQIANQKIQTLIEQNEKWDYADLHSPMLDSNGQPSEVFYDTDPLHMNHVGYGLMAKLLRDKLQNTTTI